MAKTYNEAEFRYWLETQCKAEFDLDLENGSGSFTLVNGIPATTFKYIIYPHIISPTWRPNNALAQAQENLVTGKVVRHGFEPLMAEATRGSI